jgi:hypothetical protein
MDRDEFLRAFIDKVESKLDKLHDEIVRMREVQAAQHETLKDHTRRSLANEEAIVVLKDNLIKEKEATREHLDSRFKPIDNHVKFVDWSLRMIGAVAGIGGFILVVLEIIKYLA